MGFAGLGALTGNQAIQEVEAGLEAIYLSGWQVAADANLAGEMYPDQSLYPANSVPQVVKRINNAHYVQTKYNLLIKLNLKRLLSTYCCRCRSRIWR